VVSDDLLLIHGDEPFLVDREIARWRSEQSGADVEIEVVDAPAKLAPLKAALLDLPMFASNRAVLLRDAPQLSGRAKKGADSANELAELLAARDPQVAFCIASHSTVAAGNPVIAAVRAGKGQIREYKRLKGRDLRAWVDQEARAGGVKLPPRGAEHLIATGAGELGTISGELAKLASYAGGNPLRIEDLHALCSGQEQVEMWSVMERLLGPSPGQGAAAVDSLLQAGRAPQYILITMAAQIRDLRITRALLDERGASIGEIAKSMGLPDWRAERLVRQARRVPGRTAERWMRALHDLDAAGKKGEADDAEGLRIFIRKAAADVLQ
jgi:DNA polymerase III subunit delta